MATQPKRAPAFSDILHTPLSAIEPPKPVPSGSYVAMVLGPPPEPQEASTGTKFYQFNLQLLEAENDVNKVDLQAALTKLDGTVIALREKAIRSDRYYLTDQSLFRILKFFTDLGICDEKGKDTSGDDINIVEAVAQTPGRQLRVYVTHATGPSGGVFANVTQTSPVT